MAVEVRVGRFSKRQFQALERSRHLFEKSRLSRKERRSHDEMRDEEEEEEELDREDDESLSFDEETVIVAEASLLVGKKARSMRSMGSWALRGRKPPRESEKKNKAVKGGVCSSV